MKELKKMSLAALKNLSRDEMKKIMAGSGGGGGCGTLQQPCQWFTCCPGLRCALATDLHHYCFPA